MTNAACTVQPPHPETVTKLSSKGVDAREILSGLKQGTIWVDPSLKHRVDPQVPGMQRAIENAAHGSRIQLAVVDSVRLKPAEERDLAQLLQDATCSDTTIVMTPKWGTSVSETYPRFALETNHKKLHGDLTAEAVSSFLTSAEEADPPVAGISNTLLGVALLAAVIVGFFAHRRA